MDVEVRDGFPSIWAVVDYDPKSVFQIQLAGDLGSDEEQVPEEGLIFRIGGADSLYWFSGYDEHVNRSLRFDVANGETLIVFVLEVGGDFAVRDLLEERFFFRHWVELRMKI